MTITHRTHLLVILLLVCLYLERCHTSARVAKAEAGGGLASRQREHARANKESLPCSFYDDYSYNAFTCNITGCISILRKISYEC